MVAAASSELYSNVFAVPQLQPSSQVCPSSPPATSTDGIDACNTIRRAAQSAMRPAKLALGTLIAAANLARAQGSSNCQDNFLSPDTGVKYAVSAGCGSTSNYINRFKAHCNAVPASRELATFWHIVKLDFGGTLYRDASNLNPADADFETCLKRQLNTQSSHDGVIAGAVVGGVLGGLAILGLLVCVYVRCYKKPRTEQSLELPASKPVSV